jgi:hypothetical protein
MPRIRFHSFLPLLFIVSLCCQSCILIPVVDGVKKIGLTKNDREAMLPKTVSDFQDLLYWNKFQLASGMIKEDVRSKQIKELVKQYKGYRLVETKTDYLDFDEDGSRATVTITTKRFKVPFYVVEDYTEDQQWEFSISDGWKFVSATPTPKDSERAAL